jgi:hypothetical protein
MEKNINLAKILNGKPVNTKLWSPLFGDVYTSSICSEDTIIVVNHHAESSSFYNNGKYFNHAEAELLLFPSKEMRDWSKFAWKKGDVLVNSLGFKLFFDRWANYDYTRFFGKVNLLEDSFSYETEKYTLASKEETLDTLEIEKPEFKDGDIVVAEGENKGKKIFIFRYKIRDSNTDEHGYKSYINVNSDGSLFNNMTFYLRKDFVYRPATDSEKQQLFEALAKENKVWDAEKKQIVDLKPKVELKPFDKVLVRDSESDNWRANLFGYIGKDGYYHCVFANWVYCIPYAGNEHLLGTTKDVEG